MEIYIINIAAVIILGMAFLYIIESDFARKFYIFIMSLQMALISGLRGYHVGPDTQNYIAMFERVQNYDLNHILTQDVQVERGYVLFEYVVSLFSDHPSVLFVIVSLMYCFAVGRLIRLNSIDPVLSFVIFIAMGYFTFSMTGLRQTVALTLTIMSYEFIKQKKLVPFLLLVLAASTFHVSAFVFLPFYFIGYLPFSKLYILLSLASIPVVYIFRYPLFALLSRVSGYNYIDLGVAGPTTLFLLLILVFTGGVVLRDFVIKDKPHNSLLYHAMYLSIIFTTMAFINPSALRAGYYYLVFLMVFIPEVIFSIPEKRFRTFVYLGALGVLVLLYVYGLRPSSPYMPYTFFWQ